MLRRLKSLLGLQPLRDDDFEQQQERILAETPVPVFWLLGKTGSGKTTIVRYLTGADDAEIGNGFRPQTKTARRYEFPSDDNPVMTFLDTRGLGEAGYDASADVDELGELAHVVIVTVRVNDHALDELLESLRMIRNAATQRPMLLALTCLHETYPQQQHPDPDPFADDELLPDGISEELRRSLEAQRDRFGDLVDRIVPLDITVIEEGFEQPEFGGTRLRSALLDLLPAAYRQSVLSLDEALKPLRDLNDRRAMPTIIGHSMMAATAAAVPVPWIDIPVVLAIQSRLFKKLARLYEQESNREAIANVAGAVGTRLISRMMVRELAKVIPWVGSAANAAMAFAWTYSSGKVWCWYFGELKAGNAPTEEQIQTIWKEQLEVAGHLWKKHRSESRP